MLKLTDIKKQYTVGTEKIDALRGVSIAFRKSEFVSILGPSGCGKTTLLNIIGGLDRYSSGDLMIGGVSTKEISQKTMESKLVPGLYIAGELLNLDADTGGYNLQIAFSTAALAVNHIAARNSE